MKTKKDCSVGGKENGGRRGSQRRERNRSTQQPFEDSEPQNAICRGLPRVPPVPGLRAFVTRPGELQHVPAQTHGAAWLQNPCSGTQRAMETKRSIFTSSCCRNKLLGGLRQHRLPLLESWRPEVYSGWAGLGPPAGSGEGFMPLPFLAPGLPTGLGSRPLPHVPPISASAVTPPFLWGPL